MFRQSGTGSVGATIRIYFEKTEKQAIDLDNNSALSDFVTLAMELSEVKQITGREKPSVITWNY